MSIFIASLVETKMDMAKKTCTKLQMGVYLLREDGKRNLQAAD